MDPLRFISERAQSIDASGIRRMFDLSATLTDPINFSIGQPDYAVPEPIQESAIAAIREGRNGYTPTQGIAPLVEKIGEKLRGEFPGYEPGVFVTSGLSGGLTLALLACLNPGDDVIVPDPYFVSYKHLVLMVGGVPVAVDLYDDFQLHPERFAEAVTDRTKMILVCSPGNPTGVVFSRDDVAAIAEIAERHDLLVVSDEIYCMLSYDGRSPSPVSFAPD